MDGVGCDAGISGGVGAGRSVGVGCGVGVDCGAEVGCLAIQLSKKPFLDVSEAAGVGFDAEMVSFAFSTLTTSTGSLDGSGVDSCLDFAAAFHLSLISFSTSALVLPNLVAE